MDGRKSMEIRTRLPKYLSKGDKVFVCVSGSKGKVPFSFKVVDRIECSPEYAWHYFATRMGVTVDEFYGYVSGRYRIHLIVIGDLQVYDEPLCIYEMGLNRPPLWFSEIK